MAAKTIAELLVKMGVSVEGAEKAKSQINGLTDSLNGTAKGGHDASKGIGATVGQVSSGTPKIASFGKSLASMGGILAGAVVAGAAGAAMAIRALIDETARLDKIAKDARASGLGTEAYQELDHLAGLSGTSVEVLAKGVQTLDRQLADVAKGGGVALTDALKKLGVSTDELAGTGAKGQLAMVGKALQNIQDEGERTRLTMVVFGEEGKNLASLLATPAEAMDKMAASAGKIYSAEELGKAEAFQDAISGWNKALLDVKGTIALAVAPAMTEFMEGVVGQAKDWWKSIQPVADAFMDLVGVMKDRLGPAISGAFETDRVSQMSELVTGLLERLKPMVELWAGFLAMNWQAISWVVDKFMALMGILGKIGKALSFAFPKAAAFAKGAIDLMMHPLQALKDVFASIWDWLEDVIGKKWPDLWSKAAGAISALSEPGEMVRKTLVQLFDWLERSLSKFKGILQTIKDFRRGLGIDGPAAPPPKVAPSERVQGAYGKLGEAAAAFGRYAALPAGDEFAAEDAFVGPVASTNTPPPKPKGKGGKAEKPTVVEPTSSTTLAEALAAVRSGQGDQAAFKKAVDSLTAKTPRAESIKPTVAITFYNVSVEQNISGAGDPMAVGNAAKDAIMRELAKSAGRAAQSIPAGVVR